MYACYIQELRTHCKQHNQNIHDIYLSYRDPCDYSVAEKLYQTFATASVKTNNLVVFWDKKCLNNTTNCDQDGIFFWRLSVITER